jgi:sigma-B regulation protein RsbU (phosphoserine phosphatase)
MAENGIPSADLDQLKYENTRLKIAVEELSILNEIATAISSTLDVMQVIDLIVKKCIKHLKVEQGVVMLINEGDKNNPMVTMERIFDQSSEERLPIRLNTQLTGWMMKNQKPLLSNALNSDERFTLNEKDVAEIESLLAVPLHLKGKMIGLLTVFNKRGEEGFTEDDKRLLTIIAAQSAQVIDSARLYREEQEFQKVREDMNMAAQIQQNLLPKKIPDIQGYQAGGISIPAKNVGGDYYDFIPTQTGNIAFCLGDVSGKGTAAALLMANMQATLRGQTLSCTCARDCLERANNLLFQSTDSEKYATLFYGILDPSEHQLAFTNAGHNYPFMISPDGKVERLKTIGIPLGFLEDFEFSEHTVPFNIGDILVLFSDGISEAMNIHGEEFEEERILEEIKQHTDWPPHDIIDHLINSVREHAGGEEQSDDMTLLVIKRVS